MNQLLNLTSIRFGLFSGLLIFSLNSKAALQFDLSGLRNESSKVLFSRSTSKLPKNLVFPSVNVSVGGKELGLPTSEICDWPKEQLVWVESGRLMINESLFLTEVEDYYSLHKGCSIESQFRNSLFQILIEGFRPIEVEVSNSKEERLINGDFEFNKIQFQMDLTSMTSRNLQNYQICQLPMSPDTYLENGTPIRTLGTAVVYFDPGYNTSVVGHVGLRFIYCYGEELVDVLYEITQFSEKEMSDFNMRYPNAPAGAEKRLAKKIYIKSANNAATLLGGALSTGGYGLYQTVNNRNLFETWLKLSSSDQTQLLKKVAGALELQNQKINKGQKLPKYQLLTRNCVTLLVDWIEEFLPKTTRRRVKDVVKPETFFTRMAKELGEVNVLYPSQRSLRMHWLAQDKAQLWLENLTYTSQTIHPDNKRDMSPIYPYDAAHQTTWVNSALASTVNLPLAVIETGFGLLQAPFTRSLEPLYRGLNKTFSSLAGFFGISLLHPKPSEWTQEELDKIEMSAQVREPAVLELLFYRQSQNPTPQP